MIPDASWEEVRARLAARRDVTLQGETFRVCIDGVPIRVMRLKDLPLLTEKVVLNINGDNWNETDMEAIAGLLRRGE